jgi:hypothetical protein
MAMAPLGHKFLLDLDLGAGFLELLLRGFGVGLRVLLAGFGAPSTRSFASLRPRLVNSRRLRR